MKKKILSLLVLLAAAVSGAWAQTVIGNGWSDDFEGSTCKWDLINGSAANKWTLGTATNNGGTQAIYISNDGGTTNTYVSNTGCASTVYAAKLFTFANDEYTFSYDWKANGENNYDYLRVALVPSSVTLTAQTTSTNHKSTLPTGWIALDGGSQLGVKTDWQSKSVTIDVSAGDYYMVFEWINDFSTACDPPAAIDNVSITPSSASSGPVVTFALAAAANEHGTVAFTDADGNEITSAAEGDEVTVNIVEDEGWKVYDVTAEAFAEWSDAQSRRNIPVVDKSIDLIPVDGIDNQWVFTMKSAKAVVTVDYDAILQDEWIQDIADQTYTGSELTPTLTVLFGSTPLTADEQFTVEWVDNVNAGTATVMLAAIEGSGYTGTASKTFTILQKEIEMDLIADIEDMPYTGKAQTPVLEVTYNGMFLIKGVDYIVKVANSTKTGVATITVTGQGNYKGSVSKDFNITKAIPIITFEEDAVVKHMGEEKFINEVTRVFDEGNLIRFESSKKEVATVDFYTGEVTLVGEGNTVIKATLLSSDNFEAATFTYKLEVRAPLKTDVKVEEETVEGSQVPEFVVTDGDKVLTENVDYILNFYAKASDVAMQEGENARAIAAEDEWTVEVTKEYMEANPGTYKAVITMIGDYSGVFERFIVISGEATALSNEVKVKTGKNFYDMNGRKLVGKPTKKGIYILNGKKVVIK